MKKSTRPYPAVRVDTQGVGAVAHAGGVWLTRTAQSTGLSGSPSQELAPRRKPTAVHDPAKVRTDLALSLVLGGDALPTRPCCALNSTCPGWWDRRPRSLARSRP